MYPRHSVPAAGDTICAIIAELQIRDVLVMRALIALDLLACLDIVERDLARGVSGDDDRCSGCSASAGE